MKSSFVLFVAVLLAGVQVSTPLGPDNVEICSVYPDPHFRTFHNKYYDYHGVCDLVLIKNQEFASGVGLYLHIRTRRPQNQKWSLITNVALRINNDILEVKDDNSFYVDGILNPAGSIDIGYYPLSKIISLPSTTYWVDLNPGYVAVRHTQPNYLRVDVVAEGEEFLESVGLCGTWTTPGMIGRDGGTDFPNGNEFGKDWQVRNTEPLLFQPVGGVQPSPQYPEPCVAAPDVNQIFADLAKVNDARIQCERVKGPDFKNCVFDYVVTGEDRWVQEYKQEKSPINCADRDLCDGQCKEGCDAGDDCLSDRGQCCPGQLCLLPLIQDQGRRAVRVRVTPEVKGI